MQCMLGVREVHSALNAYNIRMTLLFIITESLYTFNWVKSRHCVWVWHNDMIASIFQGGNSVECILMLTI